MGSEDLVFIMDLVEKSDLATLPLGEVLLKPMLFGIQKYEKSGLCIVDTSAYTKSQLEQRIREGRYCLFCFEPIDHHGYDCRHSGWNPKNWS